MSQHDDDDDDSDPLLAKIARRPQRHAPLHLIGTRRFELVRKLGTGAFGEVYEARDREHGSVVALKTLKSSHPDWIYRFKREFRIVGDLAHPNLVRMFELFVEDERWYLTMELIHGTPFDEHVRRTPAQLKSCFAQLALGLSELHAAGCLHRDVKPSNALVDATGKVVLLDFGLAVHQHAAVATAIAGTAPYMAPELGLRQAPTEASDWYAFGVMLYETLAGERPFAGDEAEMLRAKLRDSPPPPSDLRTGIDATLESLALRLLAPEPAARPSSTDVLRALHARIPAPNRGVVGAIVGRHDELAILTSAFETSRSRPVVVAVSGPPGIGKTALIGSFVEELRARAEPVYQGRCLERESVPFKGVDGAIDELCNDLSRRSVKELERLVPTDVSALATVFPMLARIPSLARVRSRASEHLAQDAARALRELFAKLGHVVIAIDDLQWASADSIDLLLELFSPPAPPMLVIVTHQRAQIVERFVSGLTPITIELEPLEAASVETWIADRKVAPMSTDQAMRETDGHPYLLSRLFLNASSATEAPISLASILERSLADLDVTARDLLELIVVAGGPTSTAALFAAAGRPCDAAAIDQLRRRKLIQSSAIPDDLLLDTYHPRVREIVLATMPAELRTTLAGQLRC